MRPRLVALVGLALAGGGALAYFGLVRAGVLRYNRWDRRARGSLVEGQNAPDLALTMYDGSPVRLSQLWEKKPLVLVFGSCT